MAEPNPFAQFLNDPTERAPAEPRAPENPFLQFVAESTPPRAEPAPTGRLAEFLSGARSGMELAAARPGPLSSFMRGVVGGGAGLVGGAMEMAPGAAGRAGAEISRFGMEQTAEAQRAAPVAGTVGTLVPYALPFGRALQATSLPGRVASGVGTGGALGYLSPTGRMDEAEREEAKRGMAGVGALIGGGFPVVGSGISGGYQLGRRLVEQARGRGVEAAGGALAGKAEAAGTRVMSEAAERAAAERAALEAQLAGVTPRGQVAGAPFGRPSTVAELEERRLAATTAGQTAAERERLAGRRLAGVRQEEEFGQFGLVPRTLNEVGDYIRTQANRFIESIKEVRRKRADAEITQARAAAEVREASQPFVQSEGMMTLKTDLERRLATETEPTIRAPLERAYDALFRGVRGAGGEIVVRPSFASAEAVRRRLGDAAFKAQAEGYEAMGQANARDLYRLLNDAMKGYEPSFARYLENYKRLSEPLEVASTRFGRAIMGTERDAPSFFSATGEQIANQAFRSPESVRALLAAFGNNRQLVNAAAERYFANQVTGKTAAEIRSILSSDRNRAVLRELGSDFAARLNERVVQPAVVQARRGTAAGQRSETLAREIAKTTKTIEGIEQQITRATPTEPGLQTALDNLRAALTKEQRNQAASQLIKQLESRVPPAERANLNKLVDDLKIAYEKQSRARKLLLGTVAGIGVPTAFGGKIMGYLGGL